MLDQAGRGRGRAPLFHQADGPGRGLMKAKPQRERGDLDEGEEAGDVLVVSRRNPSAVLDFD
jgi:hypothetical protein